MLTDQPDEDQARNDWEVLKHRLSEHNVPLNVKKKKQKSFFRYVIFINSIKNVTAKAYDELIDEIRKTLDFHVEGMIADDDDVPQWLRDGDYELEYHLDTAALLQMCSPYASIAAISRASGINQHQLSHYANGIKKPRPEQRRRIVDGIHKIGEELISVE